MKSPETRGQRETRETGRQRINLLSPGLRRVLYGAVVSFLLSGACDRRECSDQEYGVIMAESVNFDDSYEESAAKFFGCVDELLEENNNDSNLIAQEKLCLLVREIIDSNQCGDDKNERCKRALENVKKYTDREDQFLMAYIVDFDDGYYEESSAIFFDYVDDLLKNKKRSQAFDELSFLIKSVTYSLKERFNNYGTENDLNKNNHYREVLKKIRAYFEKDDKFKKILEASSEEYFDLTEEDVYLLISYYDSFEEDSVVRSFGLGDLEDEVKITDDPRALRAAKAIGDNIKDYTAPTWYQRAGREDKVREFHVKVFERSFEIILSTKVENTSNENYFKYLVNIFISHYKELPTIKDQSEINDKLEKLRDKRKELENCSICIEEIDRVIAMLEMK